MTMTIDTSSNNPFATAAPRPAIPAWADLQQSEADWTSADHLGIVYSTNMRTVGHVSSLGVTIQQEVLGGVGGRVVHGPVRVHVWDDPVPGEPEAGLTAAQARELARIIGAAADECAKITRGADV